MKNYVAGFMFNHELTQVALIKKARPEWQAGRYNGIGGHLEDNETYHEAMAREFFEETGHQTKPSDWKFFAELVEAEWYVAFYTSIMDDLSILKTTTDEEVVIIDVANLSNEPVISNLQWLIRLALDKKVRFTTANY
jgi:8-oxo-dGTP diphosphatase